MSGARLQRHLIVSYIVAFLLPIFFFLLNFTHTQQNGCNAPIAFFHSQRVMLREEGGSMNVFYLRVPVFSQYKNWTFSSPSVSHQTILGFLK